MSLSNIEQMEVFCAVVDRAGFSAAARALDMTATAVSRRIKALERRLGARLLHRTTRRIGLTEAGQIYYRQSRRILDDIRRVEESVSDLTGQARGTLRLAAPMGYGTRRLAPLLACFAERHPMLELRITLDDSQQDLVGGGFDLALRIGYPRDSSMIARPLASIARHVCASPAYLEAAGTPRRPEDLADHQCLHYSNVTLRDNWTLAGADGAIAVDVSGRFCGNNGELLAVAAERGLGIALLPDFLVETGLAEGRLVRLLEDYEPAPFTLFALFPSRELPAKARLLLDFLVSELDPGTTTGSPACGLLAGNAGARRLRE